MSHVSDLAAAVHRMESNMYEALSLADIAQMTDPEELHYFERAAGPLAMGVIKSMARHAQEQEFAKDRHGSCLRLNATLPDCPDFEPRPSKPKSDKPDVARETCPVTGASLDKAGQPKDKVPKAERLKNILTRIRTRIESHKDVEFAFLIWSLVSAATVPWKMAVFDEIHHSGHWSVANYSLLRQDYLGLVCARAHKFGHVHPVLVRVRDNFMLGALRPARDYPNLVLLPLEENLAAPEGYAFHNTAPLWVCVSHDAESYRAWLAALVSYTPSSV